MKVDVHGLLVREVDPVIFKYIDLCVSRKERSLEVTHGFNKGHAIQRKVLSLTQADHPCIIRVRSHLLNPGISIIDIKVNFD